MNDHDVHHGDCLDVMAGMEPDSIDAVVTDPPYGLEFMGKDWDSFGRDTGNGYREAPRFTDDHMGKGFKQLPNHFTAGRPFQAWCERWAVAVLRVLKPGGHMLAFGGTRTHHRLMVGVEDAGWEIRDTLMWLYGSGFPKSLNLDGDHEGWGTALKPGYEPILLARKPLSGTVAANVTEHGTGALHIDACRIGDDTGRGDRYNGAAPGGSGGHVGITGDRTAPWNVKAGRWPANVVLDPEAGGMLDAQTGTTVSSGRERHNGARPRSRAKGSESAHVSGGHDDSGGASRFFYCAKASGLDRGGDFNVHPTVKPVDLVRWLVRLVVPPGGTVLDPFAGSGTTGVAATIEGFRSVLVERDDAYVGIIRRRLATPIQPVLAPPP